MGDDRDDKALTVRPLPPMKVASSLQVAKGQEFVHVDRKGRVRSPARLRALLVAYYTGTIGLVGAGIAVYYAALGPAGLVVGVGLGAWVARALGGTFTLRLGQRLLMADRFDEAAAVFERLARARLVPRKLRALAEQNLAACRTIAGRHDEALALYRSSLKRWGGSRALMPLLARGGEVLVLVNLGRLPEARAAFAALGPAPEGEYLLLQHWTMELYLALAEGGHALPEDELYRRARVALGITSAAGLLGLLAWAYQRLGDEEMSRHLLQECVDRHLGPRLSGTLPLLQRWLNAQAASA